MSICSGRRRRRLWTFRGCAGRVCGCFARWVFVVVGSVRVSGLCMADASRDSLYLSLETCLRRVLRGVLYFPGCGHGFLFSFFLLMFSSVVFTRTLDRDSAIENSYVRGLFLRLFCSLDLVKVPCSVLLLFFFLLLSICSTCLVFWVFLA